MQSTVWAIGINIGAPAQPLIVSLDTGVADTWINSATSAECTSATGCSRLGGSFNAQGSTSAGQAFQYTYRDGTQASGDYVRDTLTIGGQSLQSFEFAVGTSSKATIGKFGLSYPASQAGVPGGASPYPTIYDILVTKGLINSKSFSLWLDSATSGRLIFGGVDTARYSGALGVVPIQPVNGVYKDFAITLTKISFSEQGQSIDAPSSGTALPVNIVLDSGSVFTYLPSAIATDIFRGLQVAGTSTRDGVTTAFADCNLASTGITVDFVFGSVIISIPVAGILFDFNVYKKTDKSGNQVCGLKIRPTDDSNYVLGLSFFEVAYVVFDLTNNQISLAPAKKGATDSNVIEVGQSPDTNGGQTSNNGGGPDLDGLTLVDPKDYTSLADGTFIPYEDYVQETAGGQSNGGDSNGSFFEIDPKDLANINPADLITYDQFIASLGGSTAPNPTPANEPAPPENGDQGTPSSVDQGTPATAENPADPGPVITAGTVLDPGVASLVGQTATTVLGGDPQNAGVIDPATGLPIDQSGIVGSGDPFGDSFSDPIGGGLFKRIPAPAAQRNRRSFY